MVGRLLVGFVWLNLQFSVSWLVDFQWGSCGSIFSFLCPGWQTFRGVRVAQSLVFCVMVSRLLLGFVWLNLQFSVSWQVDFQWGSCGSIFSFLCHCWQTFSGLRVAQSLVFCVMVGRLLVGFVWLNLQFSVSWLVDFQWGSCGSIFMFSVSWLVDFQWGQYGPIFSFLCHCWQTFSGVRVAQSLVFCVMVGRLLVGFVWLNLQFSVTWLVDFQWASCGSIFRFLCHGRQTFSGVRVAQSFVFCVMVGRLLVGFVWLNLQISVSRQVYFQWGSCCSIFCFLCHGWQTFSGVRVAQSLVFCVMVGRLLVGFVWLNLQFSVSWLVDFYWGSCGSIFSFLCHGWQTFSGVRVAQSLVVCVMIGRLLVGFVWLSLYFSVSWQVDFQWGSRGLIFSFLCHGWQTFSGIRVAQSLVFCVKVGEFNGVRVAQSLLFCFMVGRLLVGFAWLNLQFSVSWLVDFQWGSCGSIFSFLRHGWHTFRGVRVSQSLVFCVMVGRFLVGFVWLKLQFSVSWQVDFYWGSCGPIFSFLRHGWQTFMGVREAQSLVFCVMVGRLLVGFVGLNLQFSVSRLATFSGVRVAQSLLFCLMFGRLLVGSCGSIFRFLCHDWWNFSGVPVAQSFVFCVMVGRLLVGFVWLNLQLSVSWLVDFQWCSCGSIFSFLCHGRQIFSGLRVSQSFVFCVMVGRLLVGFVWLKLQFSVSCGVRVFLCHGRQTFSGVRVAQSLVLCVMIVLRGSCGMVGQIFSGLRVVDSIFSFLLCHGLWGSCGSIFSFCWQTFSGVRVAQSLVFCVMVGRFQWGSCGSIFSFLCHGWQTFSGVRVAQSLVFCDLVGRLGRLLVGFVWLKLQFSVSWLVDFQWGSCGSIFRGVSFLCHGRQTFSGVRVAQSLVLCVMWGSCGSIFIFCVMVVSGVRVAQSLCFLCHGWQSFSGVSVAQSLVFCVMVGRLLVGFVWLNLQFFVFFQWGSRGSCGSIFSFLCHGRQNFSGVRVAQSLVLCHGWQTFSGVRVAQSLCFLCHGWQTFSGVRVAQSLVFCVMVGRLLVGFVWLNLQFFVSWLVDFQWGSCGSIFSFLCHGWQTFSGVRVAQSLVFCVMVGRLLVGFVWLNLQFSVSWQVDFQWGSCGSIFSFLCHCWQTFSGVRVAQSLVFCVMVGRFQWGSCGSIFSFLCHGWQTFSGVRVAQSLVFCDLVGRLLVGFVWLNLLFFVSWLVDFQWASCGSIFRFLCHGRYTFSGVRVAQSFVFCVMVGRLLVGFVWLNLQFSVSWLVDLQQDSCGSIFCFLCHGRQTFSGVRVAQSLVFCVMIVKFLEGFVWLNLQFSVSWSVEFQWGSCGSIFSFVSWLVGFSGVRVAQSLCFLCHGWQTFSGVRVAQSLVFCVMVGRLLVGFVWLNLEFFVSWLVDFQWGSCGSIFSFLCHGRQTFSGVRVAQSLVFCVIVGRLLVGFVWLNLQFSVSWSVDFSGVRVAQSLVFCVMVGRLLVVFVWLNLYVFCVMVGRLLVGSVWLNLQFSVSWLVDFQWGSCGSIFSFLCHGWQTFSGVRVAQSLGFCDLIGRLLVGFVWLNLQISVSWQLDFQWGSCGSIFCFLCHGWQTFSGLRVAQSLDFCVMVGILLVGFVLLNFLFFVSWQVDFQWGSCGSIFSFLCPGWQTFSGVRVAQSLVFCVMVGRLLVGFVWLNLQLSVS